MVCVLFDSRNMFIRTVLVCVLCICIYVFFFSIEARSVLRRTHTMGKTAMVKKAKPAMTSGSSSSGKQPTCIGAGLSKKINKTKGLAPKGAPSILDAKFITWAPTPFSDKINSFRQQITEHKLKREQVELSDYFTSSQQNHLFKYFERKQLPAASAAAQQAVAAINELPMRSGKNEKKRDILTVAIGFPSDWQQSVVSMSTSFSVESLEASKGKRWYRGEIEQRHGCSEALRLIGKKVYQLDADSDGDECFYRAEKSDSVITKRKKEGKLAQTTSIDVEASSKLATALNASENKSAILDFLNFDCGQKNAMKRPAAAVEDEDVAGDEGANAKAEKPEMSPSEKAKKNSKFYITKLNAQILRMMAAVESLKGKTDASSVCSLAKASLQVMESLKKTLDRVFVQKTIDVPKTKSTCVHAERALQGASLALKKAKPWM